MIPYARKSGTFYAPTAILVLVVYMGRNHIMAFEDALYYTTLIMFIRRSRQARSRYVFYVICRDCVNWGKCRESV